MIRFQSTRSVITRTIVPVVVAVLLLPALSGCGSQKAAQNLANTMSPGSAMLTSASDMRVQLRKVASSYGSWERLRVPVNVNVESPKKISVSATATMERGKSLLISLRFIGFEVGSLYLTDQTIRVIDKMNKNYVEESIADFCSGFPITVANVQDILLGRLFIAGSDQADVDKLLACDAEIIGPEDWMLNPPSPMQNVDYGFRFSPADVLLGLIVRAGNHEPFSVLYGAPVATDAGVFASTATVAYSTGKTDIGASLQWNFAKARWNGDVELREPAVPGNYTRITAANIAKMLSGF